MLGAAGLIGGVPCLVLLALMLGGALDAGPGLLALLACLAGGAGCWPRSGSATWPGWRRRCAAPPPRTAGWCAPDATPLLPAVAEIAEGVARLARTLAGRASWSDGCARPMRRSSRTCPTRCWCSRRTGCRCAPMPRPGRCSASATARPGGGDVAALLRHPTLADAVDRALAEQRPQTADLVLPVPIAREIAAQVIPMEPALADGGRIVIVLSDRTRERAVERMRADFVANASHELRTPLASLIGFIETLRGPAEDDAAARKRFLGDHGRAVRARCGG